jgi:hypothetical protein
MITFNKSELITPHAAVISWCYLALPDLDAMSSSSNRRCNPNHTAPAIPRN